MLNNSTAPVSTTNSALGLEKSPAYFEILQKYYEDLLRTKPLTFWESAGYRIAQFANATNAVLAKIASYSHTLAEMGLYMQLTGAIIMLCTLSCPPVALGFLIAGMILALPLMCQYIPLMLSAITVGATKIFNFLSGVADKVVTVVTNALTWVRDMPKRIDTAAKQTILENGLSMLDALTHAPGVSAEDMPGIEARKADLQKGVLAVKALAKGFAALPEAEQKVAKAAAEYDLDSATRALEWLEGQLKQQYRDALRQLSSCTPKTEQENARLEALQNSLEQGLASLKTDYFTNNTALSKANDAVRQVHSWRSVDQQASLLPSETIHARSLYIREEFQQKTDDKAVKSSIDMDEGRELMAFRTYTPPPRPSACITARVNTVAVSEIPDKSTDTSNIPQLA